jgi:eukaryotic-like serine/threonine-protein kinase
MAAMLLDLEDALEVEVARAGRSTGEATTVLESVPRKRRVLTSRNVSVAGVLLVLAGTAAALIIAGLAGEDRGGGGGGGSEPAEPAGSEVTLVSAEDFDPLGDSEEHAEEAASAVDGDADTTWSTEAYTADPVVMNAAGKPGVGLIVDAGEPVLGSSITVDTPEGGWNAAVYASPDGPPSDFEAWGEPLEEVSNASAEQTFDLSLGEPAQYYLIWFTKLTGPSGEYKVEVSEVRLTATA